MAFFEVQGFARPSMTSPADFVLDVTTSVKTLPRKWRLHRSRQLRKRRARRFRRNENAETKVQSSSKVGNDDELTIVTNLSDDEDGYVSTDEDEWWIDEKDRSR